MKSASLIRYFLQLFSFHSSSGQNLEMEDEDELFNNKYLADLKEGNCVVGGTTGDSRSSRVSELMWRNSLCPPHLKSSYPAELQFASPSRFKEDDIKVSFVPSLSTATSENFCTLQTGNIDFDDSMSTKLLPGEKSRTKKDIGTTSYKKPGPPTPSKNGGRLSLQSNEIQFPRDLPQELDSKTPKRTTPGRIKAFFLGLNSNTKTGLEVGELAKKPSWTFCNAHTVECTNNLHACPCVCHRKIICICPVGRDNCFDNCFMKMLLTNIWCCTKHMFAVLSMIAATIYINRAGLQNILP